MLRKAIIVFISISILSCGYRTKKLSNPFLKIPYDKEFFTNKFRKKKQVKVPKEIDLNSIYVELYEVDNHGKYNGKYKSVIKFYENGSVNEFIVDRSQKAINFDLDPKKTGYRGVSYVKDNQFYLSLFAPVTQHSRYGLIKLLMSFKEDTLYLKYKNENTTKVYLKTKIPKEDMYFNSDW